MQERQRLLPVLRELPAGCITDATDASCGVVVEESNTDSCRTLKICTKV
jgi:hypothetical protein